MRDDCITNDERMEIQTGLTLLRKTFDDAWLKDAIENGHPLLRYVMESALWSQYRLADLGMHIEALRNQAKFNELEFRLKLSDQFIGAEAEVDAAYRLLQAGFNIELFPQIGRRKADIRTNASNEDIYLEISSLEESKKQIAARLTLDSLTIPYHFNHHDIQIYCQIYKILSKPHIQDLQARIDKSVEEIIITKGHAYISEPGVLDLLVINRDGQNEQELAQRYGMKCECSGPPSPDDDIRRLEAKIWDEVAQLPQDKPGVVVLYTDLFDFGHDPKGSYTYLDFELDEAIFAHDNVILGIVINHDPDWTYEELADDEPNYIFTRRLNINRIGRNTLIIKNKYSTFSIPVDIIRAFTK